MLHGLTLQVPYGEFLALMGPSGSGKTTLLNLIAGLDKPSRGEVWVGGDRISDYPNRSSRRWRTRNIGFIFQFYHLLPVLTAYENVELPLLVAPAIVAAAARADRQRPSKSSGLSHRHVPSAGADVGRRAAARRASPGPSSPIPS